MGHLFHKSLDFRDRGCPLGLERAEKKDIVRCPKTGATERAAVGGAPSNRTVYTDDRSLLHLQQSIAVGARH